jgi:hypothetical protein
MGDVRMKSGPRPWQRVEASALFMLMGIVSGCSSVDRELPYDKLSADYRQTPLQRSTTLDVMRTVEASQADLDRTRAGRHLVTQTDTIVASSGQTPEGFKSWFSLFAFDPGTLTATRKYFLCIDEKTSVSPTGTRRCLFPARRTLVFDSEVILSDGPVEGETEEARRITTIRRITRLLREDVQCATNNPPSTASNATLSACGALMNQVFRDALLELDRYPALARRLDSDQGMPFSHTSLDGGRIRLTMSNGVAVTQVEVGLPASTGNTFLAGSKEAASLRRPVFGQ